MARIRTKEEQKTDQLRSKYGIGLEQKTSLFQIQGSICPICETKNPDSSGKKDPWVVDHDHGYQDATGGIKIRGILCFRCNSLLGFAKDSVDILASAIRYLEKHKS